MTKKKNNNVTDVLGCSSQLDFGGVLRDVHSFAGHYLRTRDSFSIIKEHYDTFTVSYNVDNKPIQICYFAGATPHIVDIGFNADIASSLAGKSFYLYSGRDAIKLRLFYRVDGVGSVTPENGTIDVPVDIAENDPGIIVATATELVMAPYSEYFKIVRTNAVINFTATKYGVTSDTVDVDTGFIFNNTAGTDCLTEKVDLSYNASGNIVWQGIELKGYAYNIFDGTFSKNDVVEVEIKDTVGHIPEHINNSVTTAGTPEVITPVSGKITSAEVYNPRKGVNANDKSDILYVSFDGVSYTSVPRGESIAMTAIYLTDIKIDSNNDGANFEVILTHD